MKAFRDFASAVIERGETSIFVRWGGAGPPLLLLHGFPQTHLMWHRVAPLLAQQFTVVCAALRGYGQSRCPACRRHDDSCPRRATARAMVAMRPSVGVHSCG